MPAALVLEVTGASHRTGPTPVAILALELVRCTLGAHDQLSELMAFLWVAVCLRLQLMPIWCEYSV